jgi:hypothetical protein
MHVNNGAWEFTPVSYSPTDLGGKELAEYDRNCLAAIFGVPPTYFTTDTNLANLQAADEQFARFGVEPMCDSIASTLTALIQRYDPRLHFAFDPVIAEDEEMHQRVVDMRLKSGQTCINQENEELKYPKQPWGDEPLLPDNMLPLSLIIEAHKTATKQAESAIEQGEAGIGHEDQRIGLEKKKIEQGGKEAESDSEPDRAMVLSVARELQSLERKLAG